MDGSAVAQLTRDFRERFGAPPRAAARAPGRVNLIGEHTDYNEGLVLPCAIDRDTVALLAPRSGGSADGVRVVSRETGAGPSAYVDGVVAACREAGLDLPGFDLLLASDVPVGAGLASSAALELALLTALDACFGFGLEPRGRALLAHRAENGFVGVACGVMDQLASALGRRDHALRIDCRSGEVSEVPLPADRVRLLVAHSGVRRELVAGGYGQRVAECRRAFECVRDAGLAAPGARALRDLDAEDLPQLEELLEPTLLRRARHVLCENARVEATCRVLRDGDWQTAGALLREGQRSLREDFDVSTPELDALCELGDALPGVFGSRLTGAGFGGCTLHLVAPAAAREAAQALARGFEARFGRRPPVWQVAAADGAFRYSTTFPA